MWFLFFQTSAGFLGDFGMKVTDTFSNIGYSIADASAKVVDKIKKQFGNNLRTFAEVKDAMEKIADKQLINSAQETNKLRADIKKATTYDEMRRLIASAHANINESAKNVGGQLQNIYELIKNKH